MNRYYYKYVKSYSVFEHEADNMSFSERKKAKDEMREKGDYVKYVGKDTQVTNMLRSLSSFASPWVERDSPTEIKVFNTKDEDIKHEIEDMVAEFGLNKMDLNSLKPE